MEGLFSSCVESKFEYDHVDAFVSALSTCLREAKEKGKGEHIKAIRTVSGLMVGNGAQDKMVLESLGWDVSEVLVDQSLPGSSEEEQLAVSEVLFPALEYSPPMEMIFPIARAFQFICNEEESSNTLHLLHIMLNAFAMCLSRMSSRQKLTCLLEYRSLIIACVEKLLDQSDGGCVPLDDPKVDLILQDIEGLMDLPLQTGPSPSSSSSAPTTATATATTAMTTTTTPKHKQEPDPELIQAWNRTLLSILMSCKGLWICSIPYTFIQSTHREHLLSFISEVRKLLPPGDIPRTLREMVQSSTKYTQIRMELESLGATVKGYEVFYRRRKVGSGEREEADGWSDVEEDAEQGEEEAEQGEKKQLIESLAQDLEDLSIHQWEPRGIAALLFCISISPRPDAPVDGSVDGTTVPPLFMPQLPIHEYFPYILVFFSQSGMSAWHWTSKGMVLMEEVLKAADTDVELGADVLDTFSYWAFFRLLSSYMIQCPHKETRKQTFLMLSAVLEFLHMEARVEVYQFFARDCPFPSVSSLMLQRMKEDLHHQLTTHEIGAAAWEPILKTMVQLVLQMLRGSGDDLHGTPSSYLIERGDVVGTCLNIVRYLSIRLHQGDIDTDTVRTEDLLQAVSQTIEDIDVACHDIEQRSTEAEKADPSPAAPSQQMILCMMKDVAERTKELLLTPLLK